MEKEEVMEIVKSTIATVVDLQPDEIDEDEKFIKMGISSIQAIKIVNLMQERFGAEINPAILFEYETLNELINYLMSEENLNRKTADEPATNN